MPGSITSSSTTSAPSLRNASSPSSPLEATTTSKPSLRSMKANGSASESSSSTTSTRFKSWLPPPRRDSPIDVPVPTVLRQAQREGTALPRHRPDRDVTAMVEADVLDDRQAKSGATGLARSRRINTVEPFEDSIEFLGGDTDTLVGYRDIHDAPALGNANRDPGSLLARRSRWRSGSEVP